MYTFFLTFEDDTKSCEKIQRAYRILNNARELDVVPSRWLHLTVQGVGFVDAIEPFVIEKLIEMIRVEIRSIGMLRITLGPTVVAQEGVVLLTSHSVEMKRLQMILRRGISNVLSDQASDFGPPLEPHVTLAYSHGFGSAGEVKASLRTSQAVRHDVTFNYVRLVSLGRDDQTYTWTTIAKIPLE